AGDGSPTAYKRIRANSLQTATVPEPLSMHAWQIVDELNRAFSSAEHSNYVSALHLVTAQNIAYDGGQKNMFEPVNDFRAHYQKFWSK
ncbi:MAG: sugar ABC transporter substrate-binding protein, partial [Burkholderiales bacterium]|nr:sugar ABC transporter substrate-binding protein [Burkholderiales bacterium]